MRRFGLALAFLLSISSAALAGELVDRIVATVNGDPVLASDVDDAVRLEAFLQGEPPTPAAQADRKAALQRLIDRALIQQQMSSVYIPSEAQVESRLAQLRSTFPGAQNEQAWRELLRTYGVGEAQIRKNLEDQAQLLRFVDARLRPTIHVGRGEVEAYYNEKLTPELKQRGAPVEPLEEVDGRIRELLVQEKLDVQLNSWLTNLRNQGDVQLMNERAAKAAPASEATAMSVAPVRR